MKVNHIYQGHVIDIVSQWPEQSIDCVVTSPPYWGLRKYGTEPIIWSGDPECEHQWGGIKLTNINLGRSEKSTLGYESGGHGPKGGGPKITNFSSQKEEISQGSYCQKCGAWRGELGLEPNMHDYIEHLCLIFDAIKRILCDHGTLWVNLGDCYSGKGGTRGNWERQNKNLHQKMGDIKLQDSLPAKCLCLIPYRFAIAMCDRGWILRNDQVWEKPNCMPDSVKSRFTRSHEYVFHFSKRNKGEFFEMQYEKILNPGKPRKFGKQGNKDRNDTGRIYMPAIGGKKKAGGQNPKYSGNEAAMSPLGRHARTVWTISTMSYSGAHFAVFPPKLLIKPIKAGCPRKVCTQCGTPVTVEHKTLESIPTRNASHPKYEGTKETHGRNDGGRGSRVIVTKTEKIYHKCDCHAPFRRGIVFDPFMGSGTTAYVAQRLGRNWIGTELNPEYIKLAYDRIGSKPLDSFFGARKEPNEDHNDPRIVPNSPSKGK